MNYTNNIALSTVRGGGLNGSSDGSGPKVSLMKPGREGASSPDRHHAESGEKNMVVEISGAGRVVDEEREQPGVESASSPDRHYAESGEGSKVVEVSDAEWQSLFNEEEVAFLAFDEEGVEVCLKECTIPIADGNFVRKRDGTVVEGIRCKSCRVSFADQKRLEVHWRNHPECSEYTIGCGACGRFFKNDAGLRSHLGQQSDCRTYNNEHDRDSSHGLSSDSNPVQLTGSVQPHNTMSRYDLDREKCLLESVLKKDSIKWPLMRDSKAWLQFDRCVTDQLNWNGSVDQRISRLETVVYEEGKRCFGVIEHSSKKHVPPRRERKVTALRKEIKNLERLAAQTEVPGEADGYAVVIDELKEKMRQLRRKESSRKRRWRKAKARKKFLQDPYKASKELLSPKDKTPLAVDKSVMDDYVRDVASDSLREVDLGSLEGLPEVVFSKQFDASKFRLSQLNGIIRKTRNSSAPGPNGIPYKVYKKCPKITRFLFDIMRAVEISKIPPLKWRISDGVFIPKVAKPVASDINDYRQIALLNVEGKLFWSMVSHRLYQYLVVDNGIIKTAIQKGSIRGMAGCWEHTSLVWSTMKDAKLKMKNLAALWLDLANAYGSVPHKLIEFALTRYQVPKEWVDLLLGYYDGLWGRSRSGSTASDWMRYEKGVFAGCTVSVVLFLMSFNVILEFVDAAQLERYTFEGSPIEVLRGFMDDVSILTTSVPQAKKALERTVKALKWARMKLKPVKSRSIVLKDGLPQRFEPFSVDGAVIPGLHTKPLRTLGRVFTFSLSDREAVETMMKEFVESLVKIDKSLLTGFMKAWAHVHILVPQVQWDIMIYEISLKLVEKMERRQCVYLRKWLGFAKHLSNVGLFSTDVPITLPLQSLVEVFKSTKVRSFLQLKYSSDASVAAHARPYRGKKWDVLSAVEGAESSLLTDRVVGDVRSGNSEVPSRAGVGLVAREVVEDEVEGSVGHRKSIVSKVQQDQNEELRVKAVQQSLQGAWLNWSDYIRRDITWKYAFTADSKLLRFCIGVTYNTKGTPNNLKLWGLRADAECKLCHQDSCGLRHILSGCNFSMAHGRFRYRHDCVLRKIAHGIQSFLQTNSVVSKGVSRIHFVRASENPVVKRRRKPVLGILHQAADFVMDVDLEKRLKFPEHIAVSELKRPDIVLYSNSLKTVVFVELTCPCEERFAESQLAKENRYGEGSDLWNKCVGNGWKVVVFPVEVGARGYAAKSLSACLLKLGLSSLRRRTVVKEAAEEALRCSFWIWIGREDKEWTPSKGFSKK